MRSTMNHRDQDRRAEVAAVAKAPAAVHDHRLLHVLGLLLHVHRLRLLLHVHRLRLLILLLHHHGLRLRVARLHVHAGADATAHLHARLSENLGLGCGRERDGSDGDQRGHTSRGPIEHDLHFSQRRSLRPPRS